MVTDGHAPAIPAPEAAPDPFRDLNTVRPEKPLGYMTNEAVRMRGRNPEDMAQELEGRGLEAIVTSAEDGSTLRKDSYIATGGLYAYDEEALTGLLETNADVLAESEWPAEPAAFVTRLDREMVDQKESPALYKLIAWAYDDQRPELKRPEPNYDADGKLIPPKLPPAPAKVGGRLGKLALWRRS